MSGWRCVVRMVMFTHMKEERQGTPDRTDPERPCLNCGDPTPGEYCPTCGQRKVDVQVSVRTLVMDVLEDQFILDKRLPRTLKALLFQPGHLTVEHVNGRIVRYIHPFRLFLVTSLLFFLLLSFLSLRLVRQVGNEPAGDASPVASVDSLERGPASPDPAFVRIDSVGADTTAQPAPEPPEPADDEPESLRVAFGWEEDPDVTTGIAAVDSALTPRVRRLVAMEPRQAAETLVGTFFNYAPTLMFILLPVFAGVLKLLYIRRRRYYVEHFVFLLHVHSFVFVLATALLLLGGVLGGWFDALVILWILGYILAAMKRVYGQSWRKTFAKYWILGWMYIWILTFTIPVAFVATILLF